jgi:hypothetical protein
MTRILLAGVAVLALSVSAHARTVHGLPDTMVSEWCLKHNDIYARGHCPDANGHFTVQRNGVTGIENSCVFKKVKRRARNAYVVYSHCGDGEDEGVTWTTKIIFTLRGRELHLRTVYLSPGVDEALARTICCWRVHLML